LPSPGRSAVSIAISITVALTGPGRSPLSIAVAIVTIGLIFTATGPGRRAGIKAQLVADVAPPHAALKHIDGLVKCQTKTGTGNGLGMNDLTPA
jgi:hypothetical protein